MSIRHSLFLLAVVSGLSTIACSAETDPSEVVLPSDTILEAQGGVGLLGGGVIVAPPPSLTAIPAVGSVHPQLEAVDDAVRAFMRATCTGAVSVAVGFGGKAPLLARGYGYKSGPPNQACGSAGDPFVGGAKIGPNTAFRIGSNSKAITAAITRIVLKQKLANLGRPATDAELESLRVFDDRLDLVSPALRRAVSGPTGGGAGAVCVSGPVSPVMANGLPDSRWRDMTVGHLLGHRSGLPRSGNPVTSKLATIRGINSMAQLHAESLLVGAPAAARSAVAGPNNTGRFIRAATLEEYLIGNVDLCLERAPGAAPAPTEDAYSNIGYAILQHIAEHVSGRPLSAELGQAGGHDTSLIGQFLQTRLGITKGADSAEGIYFSQPIEDLRDASEPKYRGWDGTSQNGQFFDLKRPWCNWVGNRCDGSAWDSNDRRFSWDWANAKVGVSYSNEGIASGVGLLAAEMPLYLRFMAKYWVSGSGSVPLYGRERAPNSSAPRWHIGELTGSHSTVAQFNGGFVEYIPVPRKANGELDLAKFNANLKTKGCYLPMKLDLALAANQVNDAVCTPTAGLICSERYMALRDVVKEALCSVDWKKVDAQLF
ncbi:MAG TPA: serine hydrolase domain-containing protein [Labilithrix sp.]|nr:serine hydrolase domain-containing protein [Labilithrix sp.]